MTTNWPVYTKPEEYPSHIETIGNCAFFKCGDSVMRANVNSMGYWIPDTECPSASRWECYVRDWEAIKALYRKG